MSASKQILIKLIEEIPESQIPEVIDYITYLKTKRDNQLFKDLLKASESSLDFWNNDKDDAE